MACFLNRYEGNLCGFICQKVDGNVSQCTCELMEHCLAAIEEGSPDIAVKAWKTGCEILVEQMGRKNFPDSKVPPVDPDPLRLDDLADAEASMTEEEWRRSLFFRKEEEMKKYFVPRIPKGLTQVLRHKGGPQTSRKGKKGYNRQQGKKISTSGQ